MRPSRCHRLPPAGIMEVLMLVLQPRRKFSLASTSRTDSPPWAAARAAIQPAPPAPATTTSKSTGGSLVAGAFIVRASPSASLSKPRQYLLAHERDRARDQLGRHIRGRPAQPDI